MIVPGGARTPALPGAGLILRKYMARAKGVSTRVAPEEGYGERFHICRRGSLDAREDQRVAQAAIGGAQVVA